MDYTHPDLLANLWSAPSPFVVTLGSNTITCPAGAHGFNAITLVCDPMDDHGHGTHVSGTIGASGNNGAGVVGVNWITRLMGIKFLNEDGTGSIADAINGIEFAIQAKEAFASTAAADVRILSNSWGGTIASQALREEIEAANAADMLFTAAAGNNGINSDWRPTYPASYDVPNVVAVAATDNTDTRAWFSNYSSTLVDLAAPGADRPVHGGGHRGHSDVCHRPRTQLSVARAQE
jgi:subtilisin family serine protease